MEAVKLMDVQVNLAHIEKISKKKLKKHRRLNTLNGFLILFEIAILIYLFHKTFNWHVNREISSNYVLLLGFILFVFIIQVLNKGLFQLNSPFSWMSELFQLIKITLITFMITAGLLFLMKVSYDYSRIVIGLFFAEMLVITWMLRLFKRGILYVLATKKILTRNVLIIGAGKVGRGVFDRLSSVRSNGYQIVGFLDDLKKGSDIKGKLSDIEYVIEQYEVDEIIVSLPSKRNYIYNLLKNIQKYKINVKIIPEFYNLVSKKVAYDHIDPYPFVEVESIRMKGWHGFTKRMVDIILSCLAIIVLIPVYLGIWCAVKLGSPGPAIFKQKRIGKDGQHFYIYKFRSMVTDAEKRLREDPELYKKYVENNYKLEPDQDTRITKLGRFLRKTSLDELPQFFNVLKGDMSLVGPRPVINDELLEYDQLIFDFLSVKPGLTGYWQISGRSDAGYPERVDIELFYVYNQSLVLDFKIMFKTITAVLNRDGAY